MSNNRNKKFDNFGDVILSKKRRTQADIGEWFIDVENGNVPTFKIAIGQFLPMPVGSTAEDITYDNSTSGLDATNVKIAIDKLTELSSGSEYTETIVNISSAQILAMGTNPIELLPAAGVGKYYDIDKVLFESSGTIDYTIGVGSYIYIYEGIIGYVSANLLRPASSQVPLYANLKSSPGYDSADGIPMTNALATNRAVELSYYDDTNLVPNPTGGDGTLRVKIYHKTLTFGS